MSDVMKKSSVGETQPRITFRAYSPEALDALRQKAEESDANVSELVRAAVARFIKVSGSGGNGGVLSRPYREIQPSPASREVKRRKSI